MKEDNSAYEKKSNGKTNTVTIVNTRESIIVVPTK